MQLSGLNFLYVFLPVTLIVYYFPYIYKNNTLKNAWLFIISLVFYLWTSITSVIFLIVSIVLNYGIGLWLEKYAKEKTGKRIVLLACSINLASLVFYKYSYSVVGGMSAVFGFHMPEFFESIVLPLGISFYTFKTLSYIIDVYRKKVSAQKNIVNLGLYLSFFPCAISGPIFKYNSMIAQIENRQSSVEMFGEGVKTFIYGMAKSVILGSQLLSVSQHAFSVTSSELSVIYAWLGAVAYTMYIYFDFSGYSQMAIGIGRMFGIEIPQNFNYPYISRSVSEYWRRWHITLGEWFQEYLYYPLSLGPAIKIRKFAGKKLNRKHAGMVSIAFSLIVVWLCTGVWHGSNMTFVVWGLLNFLFVFIDTYFKPSKYTRLTTVIGFLGTSFITLVTKVIFNSTSLYAAGSYIASMFYLNGNKFIDPKSVILFENYIFYFVIGFICVFPVAPYLERKFIKMKRPAKILFDTIQLVFVAGLFIISLAYVNSSGHSAPMYANF